MLTPDRYKNLFHVLQEISHVVVFTNKITSIANFLLDVAIRHVEAEKGSLMLLNEKSELYILSARGHDPEFIKNFREKLGEGIAGIVAANRKEVLVTDINDHPEFRSSNRTHYKTRSFISCPVIFKHKLLGVININDKKDGTPFTSDDFDLLRVIANHAAIALENASLVDQLKSRAFEIDQMNKQLVNADLHRTEFLTRVSHELRTPLNALKGAIYVLDEQGSLSANERKEFQSIIAREANELASIIDNLLRFLQFKDESRIIDKTLISINQMLLDLPSHPQLKNALRSKNISLIVHELPRDVEIFGDKVRTPYLFVNLLQGLLDRLDENDQIEISCRLSENVLIDISLPRPVPKTTIKYLNGTVHLFHPLPTDNCLRLHLARNIVDLHAWSMHGASTETSCTVHIAIPLNSKDTQHAYVRKSLEQIIDHVSDSLDLDICSVMMSDDLTGELKFSCAHGLDEDIVKTTRIKFGDKIAGWVALEGKPLLIENIEDDPRFAKKSIPQYYTKSLMSVPLKVDDTVIGVFNLNNKKSSEPFTAADFRIAQTLATTISGYLDHIATHPYREDELQQFLSTLDDVIKQEKAGGKSAPSLS